MNGGRKQGEKGWESSVAELPLGLQQMREKEMRVALFIMGRCGPWYALSNLEIGY